MDVIDSKPTSDAYTDAVTISDIWGSNGGYFTVTGASVYAKLQTGKQGLGFWTREVRVDPGNGTIYRGTSGITFRSAVAGTPATISAAISDSAEPSIALAAGGQVTSTVAGLGIFNVKDYGAKGDGVADDSTAILTAYSAIPAAGGTLYFPPGTYTFGSQLSFTNPKPLAVIGGGEFVSILQPTFPSGDAFVINGPSQFSIEDIGFFASVRDGTSYLLAVENAIRVVLSNLYLINGVGGLMKVSNVSFAQIDNCQGQSSSGGTGVLGGTCIRLAAVGATVTNCSFRNSGGAPCLWISGTSTSIEISNSQFAGGGPISTWAISGIASDPAKFTVTTSLNHDFQAGDFVAIRGASVGTYNDCWRIATIPTASSFTVTTTANPGAATGGTAESISACGLVTNDAGSCNEISVSNVLFASDYTVFYGTASLYLDGRRGVAGSKPAIAGWNISSCYFDYGAIGLLLSGTAGNVANQPTTSGIAVSNCTSNSATRGIHVDQVPGVVIANCFCAAPGTGAVNDQVSTIGPTNAGIYVYSGPSAPFTVGVTIVDCNSGMPRSWDASLPVMSYGLFLDGAANLNDLLVTGNQFHGSGAGIVFPGSPVGASRWRFDGNQATSGVFPPTSAEVVPTTASATTLNIPSFSDFQLVSGNTNISTVNVGWVGRIVTLMFQQALTLLTGGNLALGANYSVLQGQLVTFVFDGTSWYLK